MRKLKHLNTFSLAIYPAIRKALYKKKRHLELTFLADKFQQARIFSVPFQTFKVLTAQINRTTKIKTCTQNLHSKPRTKK